MPTKPSGEAAVPMLVRSRTIYLTTLYDALHASLFWGAFVLFACAVIIDVRKDPFQRTWHMRR
ncbi:hypothetical protein, partial [Reyranella soli]|uniref:hypothetical protein n=1 Tax=Reyranella soli TaxID=1230389 RepID=UPI001C3FF03D